MTTIPAAILAVVFTVFVFILTRKGKDETVVVKPKPGTKVYGKVGAGSDWYDIVDEVLPCGRTYRYHQGGHPICIRDGELVLSVKYVQTSPTEVVLRTEGGEILRRHGPRDPEFWRYKN